MKKYDFALAWSGTIKEQFVDFVQQACQERNITFLWISEDNVKAALSDLNTGRLKIKVLLDTEATYNKKGDLYTRICYAVKDSGGAVINDPDRTKVAVDKSIIHYELMNAGILTPYTVIVRNWEPDTYKLASEERSKLGVPFIIKPALGYGQLGVIRDAQGSIQEIAHARNFDQGDNFLLQEKIIPIELESRRAWFRVFNVFNTIIPCWWDDHKNHYEHVSYEEFNKFGFYPLVKIVSKISAITRMAWFSTEIAIDKKNGSTRFLAIDYVNDQCDMSTRSETPSGVPDNLAKHTAAGIVDAASFFILNKGRKKRYAIWLKDADIKLYGLGSAQDFLEQPSTAKPILYKNFR